MVSFTTVASFLAATAATSMAAPANGQAGECDKFYFSIINPFDSYDGWYLKNLGGPIGIEEKPTHIFVRNQFNNFHDDGAPMQVLRLLTRKQGQWNVAGDLISAFGLEKYQALNSTFYEDGTVALRLGGGESKSIRICEVEGPSGTERFVSTEGPRVLCVNTGSRLKATPAC